MVDKNAINLQINCKFHFQELANCGNLHEMNFAMVEINEMFIFHSHILLLTLENLNNIQLGNIMSIRLISFSWNSIKPT